MNAGQTCLAPDYLFLPEGSRDRFVAAAERIMPERYPDTNDGSYTSVIDDKSYRRLRMTLEDAEAKGAKLVPLVPGATFNDVLRKIPPHLVLDVTDDMMIMQEEIFGPLFPVMTYQDLDEPIEYITKRDRPLGFYVFTHKPCAAGQAPVQHDFGWRHRQQLHHPRCPTRPALRRCRRKWHGAVSWP